MVDARGLRHGWGRRRESDNDDYGYDDGEEEAAEDVAQEADLDHLEDVELSLRQFRSRHRIRVFEMAANGAEMPC